MANRILPQSMLWRWTLLSLWLVSASAWSTTPAGTLIRNQASASYLDVNGERVNVTSNIVETRIEQIAGLALVETQQNTAIADAMVRFSHRITNTGNAQDTYSLQLLDAGGNTITMSELNIYADVDRNGIADSTIPISSTPSMAAGASFHVLAQARVPASANAGDMASFNLVATSTFDTTISQLNTDTVIVDDGATLRLSKSISRTQGETPSGPYTVQLRYENTGAQSASSITIIDALPVGMSYVPGSAQWSESINGLSDSDPFDTHTGAVSTARYCAYDISCTGLAEAQLDPDNNSDNQVTFMLDTLVPGDLGSLSFQVSIDAQLAAGELINQAEYEMISDGTSTTRAFSNRAGFTVLPRAGVVANGSITSNTDGADEPVTHSSAAQGGRVLFSNIIWNTGNQTDTFNIELQSASSTMPTGSAYSLLRSDNATPMQDTNNDGIIDTGPIAAGSFATVILGVDLPADVAGNNSGAGYSISKLARSINNSTVFSSVTDHLDQISANQVDLTNQAPAGHPDALGIGPGPEALPVSIISASAGGQVLVDLYIRHMGVNPDSYELAAFGNAAGDALAAGWSVRFVDPLNNDELDNTGPLASGESRHVVAQINVPELTPATQTSVFFRARSALTGASDTKHDAIVIATNDELTLAPSLSAQTEAGGSVLYRHTVSNIGNAVIDDIKLQLSHSLANWTGTLIVDSNANGLLDATDMAPEPTLTLAPGEFLDVFVKVFAPANANVHDVNISTVQASWSDDLESLTITDRTTLTDTHVSIRKEQAIDLGCDGIPDPNSMYTSARINVPPGNNCVVYRLSATNTGLTNSYNVLISDRTPSYTRYRPNATCSRLPCWIIEPGFESTGAISAETDMLLPGASFHLVFSVRIE